MKLTGTEDAGLIFYADFFFFPQSAKLLVLISGQRVSKDNGAIIFLYIVVLLISKRVRRRFISKKQHAGLLPLPANCSGLNVYYRLFMLLSPPRRPGIGKSMCVHVCKITWQMGEMTVPGPFVI